MGLIVKELTLSDGNVFTDCYLKVKNTTIASNDYEFFEFTDNVEETGIEQVLKFTKRLDSHATIFVWTDYQARLNNVPPIHWFKIDFNYELSTHENVFEQAYKKLNILFPDSIND